MEHHGRRDGNDGCEDGNRGKGCHDVIFRPASRSNAASSGDYLNCAIAVGVLLHCD